jgi:type II secretory pathway component GspD/PulD (secretin)
MNNKCYLFCFSLFLIAAIIAPTCIAQPNTDSALSLDYTGQVDNSSTISLDQVLRNVQKNQNIGFLYDSALLDGKVVNRSDLPVNDKGLVKQLRTILKSFGLTYEHEGGRS